MSAIVISFDETHHILGGEPLYADRFDKVQSFHFPLGYAPVMNDQQAFFINVEGKPVFERSFKEAFGFYDDIATVVDESGFFHIDKQGEDIHSQRFSWSGNFQEGLCVVKDKESGLFFHIDRKGDPIYMEKYPYTGDYRYGVAVITNQEGLCTHIDKEGQLLHGKFFSELDVYHKGFAIAKDERGYFHIDKAGESIYADRYIKLEPFYNNRAVAIDQYHIKYLISTKGETIDRIDNSCVEREKVAQYYADEAFSYWRSRIMTSVLELGIFELIEQGILVNELDRKLHLPKKSIELIVRWLMINKLIKIEDGRYYLSLSGEVVSQKLKHIFSYWQGGALVKTSLELTDSLKQHESSFIKQNQCPYFEYVQKSDRLTKDLVGVMHYYSTDYTEHLPYLEFSNEIVCDIGGGDGSLLDQIKNKYSRITPVILDKFDYTNGNADIDVISMDFLQTWSFDADVYLLSRVLHDWDDQQATILLTNIAENMQDGTILYVFETLLDDDNVLDKGVTISFHLLNLLGGRERSLAEFEVLFQHSGLKIKDVYLKNSTISLMKVVKK